MQRHLLHKHQHVQQSPNQLRRNDCRKRVWQKPQRQCLHSNHAAGTRLAALPVQPSTAGQDQQQQQNGHQQGSSSSRNIVKLVEVQDRRRTTYSWQPSSSSSSSNNGSDTGNIVSVQHEQQQEEQDGQQLLPSLPGRQQLLDALKTLYLPAGYPNTVTGQQP